jgi:putative endonuclease
MKTYYVYILKCSDDSYYTGITSNLEKRLAEHNEGTDVNSYVSKRRPVTLVWFSSFSNPETAIAREKQIKGWTKAKKEALILNDWDKLTHLSKKKFS